MTFKYQPGNPPEKNLQAWLADELRRISNSIGTFEFAQLTPIDVEPQKPHKGMVVWAEAVTWNPGAGEGLYVYNESGTWDRMN